MNSYNVTKNAILDNFMNMEFFKLYFFRKKKFFLDFFHSLLLILQSDKSLIPLLRAFWGSIYSSEPSLENRQVHDLHLWGRGSCRVLDENLIRKSLVWTRNHVWLGNGRHRMVVINCSITDIQTDFRHLLLRLETLGSIWRK